MTCIEILQTNIDGNGSALITTADIEVIAYKDSSHRDIIIRDEQYSIVRYTELETMLLSKDWVFCDTSLTSGHGDLRIEKIIKRTQKVTKK